MRIFRLEGYGPGQVGPAGVVVLVQRRNELWLHALEFGLFDAGSGRCRRHSVEELAGLWAVDCGVVRRGIAAVAIRRAWRQAGREVDP